MRGIGYTLVCAVALAANCTGEPVSLGTLLDGLTDRTSLTYYPERDYRIRNWSSYDRKSVSPDAAGWFANDDVNQFIRTEGVEQVMVDAKGPGAIVRLWVTGAAMSNGVIRIYLDGSTAFEGEAWALCGGTALCGEPLSFFTTPPRRNPAQCGRNLILPIPYARSCKVTFEPRLKGCKLWYNVETRSYADGVPVETLTGKGFASAADKVGAAAAALSDFSRIAPDARTGESLDGVIPPGGSLVREIRAGEDGARAIRRLALRVDDAATGSLAVTAALDRVSVELDFDGVAKSAMPLGAFFGTGPWELTPYRTRFTEVTSAGTMENRLVMPFRSSATIRLVNASDRPVRIVDSALAEGPYAWVEGRSMRLAATYVRRRGISSSKGGRPYDLTFDETTGKGVLVGTMVFVGNALNRPKASWWGEGDEKVWVDGETFPSVFGTGTEDYFNYAWCRPEAFSQAFCAQPSGTGNLAPGRSANIRWRQLDAIPFAKSLRFDMEMWHWDRAVMLDYDSVSWRYMLEERPAYGWRGLLLDSSRHFFTVPEIRKTLDTMAAQGLNVLHWHLVDGAGWRLRIDRYPLLTEKGAVRNSNFGAKRTYLYMHDASASPDGKYGPFFYTKDDVRGIVAYAAKRGIRVVPEIEIPGHEDAAIRCYPFLRCPRGGCEICIGSDEAIGFFENVLDEVVELFPDEVVHIGGDECNMDAWTSCPKCQARLKAIGKTDVRALQHWVTAHFAEYLAKKGRRIMGWGDIYGGEGLPKTAIVQVWDKPEVAARATRDGYDIVYSVSGTSYLDYAQRLVGDTYEYPSFAGWMTCETVYRYFNPSAGVAAADRGHVLGGEGCAWTENIADQRELEWKCWPRLAIIADLLRTGTPVGRRDWAAYRPKLERVREDLVKSGVNAAPLGPLESGKLSALPADCTATAWNGSTCPVFGPKVTRETKNLVFKRDAAVPAGGFRIRMSWREIRVCASDAAGEDHALEVLNRIAIPREGGRVLFVPNVEISGKPESRTSLDCERTKSTDGYSRPVRPGGDGRPFWNAKAVRFMYAPSFDFKEVKGAVRYRYEVLDDNDGTRTFEAARPTESLASVWAELPVGWTRVTCVGLDGNGRAVGKAGERTFWKKSGYRQCAAKPKRGYGEAAALARRFVLTMPQADNLVRTGKPDHSYVLNGYPSKILSTEIGAAVALGRLDFARAAADHLIATQQPAGTPLESFTPTYEGKGEYGRSEKFRGRNMLVYPAEAGVAFLKLGACTGEGKYLAAAEAIAARYLKLQGADGTWPVVVDERDGRPVFPNRLIPTGVIDFLEQMYERTKRPEYRQAAGRAFAFIERGPLVDWNWSAQYEDSPVAPPYENLTLHEAAWTAMYLLRRRPGDAKSLATARELARFCEDQFVCWENPYAHGRDPKWYDGERRGAPDWCVFPCALEQYACYIPIDACAARMVQLHLALYRAEGRAEDLERARAFGTAIVAAQGDDGYIATFWCDRLRRDNEAYHMWVNCMLFSADALDVLAGSCERYPEPAEDLP